MTNEEAIERINEHIAIHRYNEPHAIRVAEALQMAISALEKQIPKKTIKPDSPFYRYACPKCGNYPLHGQFCDECGQRIVYDKEWMRE